MCYVMTYAPGMASVHMANKHLVGKPVGKRPRHRQEDIIRMDLKKIGWEGVDWIHLAQAGSITSAEILNWVRAIISFSRKTVVCGVSY